MVRNALIAAGNGNGAELDRVSSLLDDPAPIVRGAAAWALGQLDPLRFAVERDRHFDAEADADVRAEWKSLLPAR